jgi:hypothetical protein
MTARHLAEDPWPVERCAEAGAAGSTANEAAANVAVSRIPSRRRTGAVVDIVRSLPWEGWLIVVHARLLALGTDPEESLSPGAALRR